MRKFLTVMLSVIAAVSLSAAFACGSHTHTYSDEWTTDGDYHWHAATCEHEDEVSDKAEHTWVATEETDEDGNVIYQCSVCGYKHAHTFSSAWTTDRTAHWHASTCGHDVVSDYEEHQFENGECIICGYDETLATEYSIYFSYYTDDNESGTYGDTTTVDGTSVSDTYRGVTYTAVDYTGCLYVDVDGDTALYGEKIAFTVKKSVFCYYTDTHDYPVVLANEEAITPITVDGEYVYIVTIEGDTIITVNNVETSPSTIGGSGTEASPYTINSVADWLYFANYINNKDFYLISWNTAYWKLTCDLDFEGESIYIIGDGYSSDYSYFFGNFDGGGHTISNFALDNAVADAEGTYSTYIGVFGVVWGYQGVDTCVQNLNVKNFTIDAGTSASSMVAAGGIVGNLVGASVINCTVENCVINITGDDSYYSYGGGIAGVVQSGYSSTDGLVYYASVQYCVADADISGTGLIYAIGGIAGRTFPYNNLSPVFLYNNISSGTYTDAYRSGGIVGYAGRYTSVQNCYSTADITVASTDSVALEDSDADVSYADTPMDDRYCYAGGIVGYAENDTVIMYNFYADGTLSASASLGSSYAKTGEIVGGYCKAGFEDYRAEAAKIESNLTRSDTITDETIKSVLGWSTVDWVFGDGYPAINGETESLSFTITVMIGNSVAYSYTVSNLYRPLNYWYIIYSTSYTTETVSGIPQYLVDGTNITYGYYFDEACTDRVPDCYVIMADITIYAKYADYAEVAGTYAISSNGITAELVLNSDGTYELTYDAIYLSGEYEYNGEYVTMRDSYFARFISSATTTQQETYYTFWLELNESGDLIIYDCESLVKVSENYDAYGYSYLARISAKSDPLLAVSSANSELAGKYYYASGTAAYDVVFDIGYTGTLAQAGSTITFTYYYKDGVLYVETENNIVYTASLQDGKIYQLSYGSRVYYTLTPYDDFEGTWEQSATIDKSYTFDGKGGWTYSVDGTQIYSGEYTVNANEELTFERGDGVNVTVTLNSDGTLNVKEDTGSVSVTYYGAGGYQGTWYTSAARDYRYTLELSGFNANGLGTLSLSGAGVSISDMRYISVDGVLYAYDGDTVYATMTYSASTGLLTGNFYNSTTEGLDTVYTFFLYDDFYGDWFSSIEGLKKLTFNGMGAYNVAASTTDGTIAVSGSVTINDTTKVSYGYSEDGDLQFTYDGVTYTITYDENNNTVAVVYEGGYGTLIAGDSLYGVTYVANGETYVFDGAGNTDDGGTVVITGNESKSATYKIDAATGVITITYEGVTYATFTPVTDENGDIASYTVAIGGESCTATVKNNYTGTWVVVGGYVTFVVSDIYYFVDGTVGELTVTYIDEDGDSYDIVAYYDGSEIWFNYNSYTVYYIVYNNGYMFLSSVYNPRNAGDDDVLLDMCEPDGYRATYTNGSDVVSIGGDSLYADNDGFGNALLTIGGVETECWYKVDELGNITIYSADGEDTALYTFNVTAETSGYECGGVYRELVALTSDDTEAA